MAEFRPTRFQIMPPIVKNLIIINVLMWIASIVLFNTQDVYLTGKLGMFYFDSWFFEPWQLVTHMFMHANVTGSGGIIFFHILFNMFALWMFGSVLESVWGPKRFLIFYFVAGFGAVFLHQGVQALEVFNITGSITNSLADLNEHAGSIEKLQGIYSTPTVGASGAIYGVLVGFAVLFPNTKLMMILLPIPIAAKYFVPVLIAIDLYLGVGRFSWDNTAHFAHLGGALFGFILIMIWKRDRNKFY